MVLRSKAVAGFLALLFAFLPLTADAARGNQSAPKLLNLYLDWQIKDADMATLSQWDLVILDMDIGWQFPDKIRQLRKQNPNIKIIAYVSAGELADARATGHPTSPGYKLAQRAPEAFYMHGSRGQRLSWWPGAKLMNATDLGPTVNGGRWNTVLPQFVHDELMSTGLWDGVFLDAAYSDVVSFFGKDIDPDGNGTADAAAQVNTAWQAGMSKLLTNMRTAVGPQRLIMVNSSDVYASQVNGVLFENFPRYGWGVPWKAFRVALGKNISPAITAFNTNTNNQEQQTNYRLMRFGLTSALLANGFYSFDAGDRGHARTWWYDEYDATLGTPRSTPRAVQGGGGTNAAGVWMREYEQGLVVVNSDSVPRRVTLPGVFERLRGTQDRSTNDGSLTRTIDLASQDGVILLGRADVTDVRSGAFPNGEFVRVYNAQGTQQSNGFFAQRTDQPSGATVFVAPDDTVVSAVQGEVRIQRANGPASTFRPFGAYKGQLALAVGNVNRDAAPEIVISRDHGGPSEVRTYTLAGKLLNRWFAYQPRAQVGARVAVGDINGDGLQEIVTGSGPGGGPHIRIFKTDGSVWGGSFFAFDAKNQGGVSVAVGDVDGDGKDDIIAGSGQGAIPRVRIFDFHGTLKREFSLGSRPLVNGITVTAADVNGDGKKEIVVGGIPAF